MKKKYIALHSPTAERVCKFQAIPRNSLNSQDSKLDIFADIRMKPVDDFANYFPNKLPNKTMAKY